MSAALALLIVQCAPTVHPTTLHAIVQHESRGRPYAIGINGGPALRVQPVDAVSAAGVARSLISQGVDFDAGLAQINVRNWRHLALTPDTVFDPCTNLAAAARILSDCYQRALRRERRPAPALQAALSCYNTGHFSRGLRNGYVQAVAARAGVRLPRPAPARGNTARR